MVKRSPTPSPPINAHIVAPLDAKRESIGLFIAIEMIVLLMALRFFLVSGGEDLTYLRSYQRLDTTLVGTQRSLYQTLLTSVSDIEYLRDQQGRWPSLDVLKTEGIPPFASDFLPSSLQSYTWSMHDGGAWVDYLGINPDDSEAYSFIFRVIDLHKDYHPHPHPGKDYDPDLRLAAQLWVYPEPVRPYPGERLTEADWWWVLSPDDPVLLLPQRDRTPMTQNNPSGVNQ